MAPPVFREVQSRRPPPAKRQLTGDYAQDVTFLSDIIRYIQDSRNSFPGPHAETHRPDSLLGDKLPIGVPLTIGLVNNPGESNDFARGAHSHRQGIVDAAGEILTHNATDPAALNAPTASDLVLTADLTAALKMKWGDPMPLFGVATRTSVGSSAASVTLLAANTNRRGGSIFNDSTKILYVGLGSVAASATNFTAKLNPDDVYQIPPGFTGAIQGIWDAVNGNARVTELTI